MKSFKAVDVESLDVKVPYSHTVVLLSDAQEEIEKKDKELRESYADIIVLARKLNKAKDLRIESDKEIEELKARLESYENLKTIHKNTD